MSNKVALAIVYMLISAGATYYVLDSLRYAGYIRPVWAELGTWAGAFVGGLFICPLLSRAIRRVWRDEKP